MNKVIKTFLIIIGIVAVVYIVGSLYEKQKYIKRGEPIIEAIDSCHLLNDSLPNDIDEIGFPISMSDGPYYEKTGDHNYKLYFTIGFDEFITYYSQSNEWRYEP